MLDRSQANLFLLPLTNKEPDTLPYYFLLKHIMNRRDSNRCVHEESTSFKLLRRDSSVNTANRLQDGRRIRCPIPGMGRDYLLLQV